MAHVGWLSWTTTLLVAGASLWQQSPALNTHLPVVGNTEAGALSQGKPQAAALDARPFSPPQPPIRYFDSGRVIDTGKDPQQRQAEPDLDQIELRDLDGNMHSLVDHRGHPVVIVNVNTWCPICAADLEELEITLWRQQTTCDVQFWGVSHGATRDDQIALEHELGLSFPLLNDPTGDILKLLSPRRAADSGDSMPLLWVIDGQGHIAYSAESREAGPLTDALHRILAN